ncbi:MAG: flagellar export chaperone FliS [Treponema sp.]|jgi:flagellar protein FliS|nr:flagellar export chaperone FliS [Treponema sp.]
MEGNIVANSNTNALSVYRETRIKTAGQGQLIIMLYNEAVKYLDQGVEFLERYIQEKKNPGRIEQIGKSILKSQEIISELMVSLDFERGGEIARNLFSLYSWFNQELLEANITLDMQRIINIRDMVIELRGAWGEAITKTTLESNIAARTGLNISG